MLKGDDTIVTDGERVAVNAISAPALATAGSGDVLSGIIAALLARGLEPFAAACAAVLAHARAGREAAGRVGAAESVIASDVIDSIPAGLRRRRAGRIISLGMKTAAEIMNADVPSVAPDDDARDRDRPAREDRHGRRSRSSTRTARWSGSSASPT